MGNSIPGGGAGATAGTGSTSSTQAAMQSATQQMEQILSETTTFQAMQEDIKAGITAGQSVTQPGVGG
jgi:hypothetical protein